MANSIIMDGIKKGSNGMQHLVGKTGAKLKILENAKKK